ncbi:MAG: glycosyltransferase [Endomicrobiaceae bacterium]|nr:glycosyltransferase [Endomicrobiaceae bacterium]
MTIISVVIPVYNVEKYLKQCLDSVISQTFTDFECICVNDGSTDNSLSILQEYATKDKRFKIFSKENRGISDTRNAGIELSIGEYITFIDSDDWVENNFLERLYSVAISESADIVSCNWKFYFNNEKTFEVARVRKLDIVNNNDTDSDKLYKGYHGAYVWRKLYRTNIIKDNNICFYKGKISEDGPFSGLVYLYADNFVFIYDELYLHRTQITSLTTNCIQSYIDAFENCITLTKELENRKFNSKEIKKFLINTFIYKLGKLGKDVSKERQKELLFVISEHMKYLKIIAKNTNMIYELKVNFVLYMINKFGIKSFRVLRILKNIM